MAEKNISTDLFVGVNSYVDLASIGVLSKDTGGQVFFYPGFQLKKDAFALENDLYRSISRLTGFDSVMVVRSSSGLKQVEDFGNFFRRNPGEFDLPVIDSDKSFVVRFEYESQLTAGQNAVFQSALLFTSESGERKIRIHTLSVPITSEISKVYRYADIDSIINVSLKTVVNHIRGSSTVQFRKLLKEASTETLYTYRKKCASNTSAGQLILPEALKLLPLYTLGMIKNGCLADYTPSDDRNYLFNVINMSPIALTVSLCSPRLYALHKLTDDVCVWGEDGSILLPQLEVVSKDFLEESGIYLLDSGLHLVIWIGAEADPNQIFDLFGISTLDGYDLLDLYIYPNEDPYSLSSKTNTLIEYLRLNRPFYANLRALSSRHMQDSIDVRRFYNSLIEDSKEVLKGEKALGSDSDRMSYVDFLCYLHRKIQDRFK
jgi:protein transport protein SEC24